MKKEKKGIEQVFGKGACLNPSVVQRCLTDNDTPLKLGFLVFCDTLDELYHGLYDASLISAVRTSVFLGIISDSFSKTTANIRKENESSIDNIIQLYLDFKNQKQKVDTLEDEVLKLEEEI